MNVRRRTIRRFNPDGNERLTSSTGLVLIVLSLAEIATLLIGLRSTLSWHVAVGLALVPPIALKLASTGWRFVRYYTRNRDYRARGAPQIVMRLLAPLLVFFTVVLFGSGIAMGFLHGHALHVARRLHGPAAVGWMLVLGLHVLVYLRRAVRSTAADVVPAMRSETLGAGLRGVAVAGALGAGLVVAVATLPDQHSWLHLPSKHDGRHAVSRFGRTRRAVGSRTATRLPRPGPSAPGRGSGSTP
jgi:hypothetical protein